MGLIIIAAVYVALAAFLVFALRTPRLERYWRLEKAVQNGDILCPGEDDFRLLDEVIARYPTVSQDLLRGRELVSLSPQQNGWSTTPCVLLLRSPKLGGPLKVQIEPVGREPASQIVIRTARWQKRVELHGRRQLDIDLQPPGERPEIIEILLADGETFSGRTPAAIRIEP